MKLPLIIILASLLISKCACTGNGREPDVNKENGIEQPELKADAYAWVTTADQTKLFVKEGINFGAPGSMSPYVVKFTDDNYQTIDGFGAAITVSSCYNLLKMPASDRTAILKAFFDTETGVGSGLVRVCIGGSDFSYDYGESGISADGRFTWCDTPGMENFAPHPMDVKYVVPVLKEIYAINPDLKIIGSPWTAPRWMKEDYSWTGSRLKKECYADYAQYFVKWIQYMEGQGFDIYAVTPENEPLNAGNSMSMLMYWDECRDFVKVLGPAFENAGIDTKILIFDHNYNYDGREDQRDYPLKVYADGQASKYIAGSAWHNYGGDVSELDRIVSAAPDKEIYFTEASIGTWNYTFDGCLLRDFKDIFLGTLSRGGKGVTLWNLMLDDNRGPYTNASGSCTTCYGAVMLLSSDYRTVIPYTHYYNIAHASIAIGRDAVRIGTNGFTTSGLDYQAYRNTDGSYGVIILNENPAEQMLVFCSKAHSVKYTVPGKSIVSLRWKD